MSLKAYDGMMTRKGFDYLYNNIKEKLPLFEQASKDALGVAYADLIREVVDNIYDENLDLASRLKSKFKFSLFNEKHLSDKIDNIKADTVISYMFQAAKVLSRGEYKNDFTVHLHISFEPNRSGDKLLVYPNILVPGHREILLSFLNDWYCQNQCDPDENVPEDKWKERSDDWWKFNEVKGLSSRITLFDPNHYWNKIIDDFRGDELIDGILKNIPSDESRIRSIAQQRLISLDKENKPDWGISDYMNKNYKLINEESHLVDEYIRDNEIILTKIDSEFLEGDLN